MRPLGRPTSRFFKFVFLVVVLKMIASNLRWAFPRVGFIATPVDCMSRVVGRFLG